MRRKDKFTEGQVVMLRTSLGTFTPGVIKSIDQKITVEFFDFDNGDRWSWDYDRSELRPLTKKERGL
jgi:hypothetical protein